MSAVLVLAGATGCGGGSTGDNLKKYDYSGMKLGADVSSLGALEAHGGVYKDAGTAGDAIAILASRGQTLFRLRLFVQPNDSDVQVNDLAYTITMAQRVKAAGGQVLLDIHYSDTWADPGHQATPAAWSALPIDTLVRRVHDYTDSVVTQMKNAGVLPWGVQIGNEVDAGMLWPLGHVGGADDTPAQWLAFTRLLKAGIQGVHDAAAAGDSVKIVIQYGQGGSVSGTEWFYDHVTADSVPFDIIGLSYYPWWHGSISALAANLGTAAGRYGKDVMVVETSYPWRSGGWEGMVQDSFAMTWSATAGGQAQYVRAVLDAVAAVPNHRGKGLIWWYPEAIQVPGLFVWGGGSLSLFDASGNVLPAATTLGGH